MFKMPITHVFSLKSIAICSTFQFFKFYFPGNSRAAAFILTRIENHHNKRACTRHALSISDLVVFFKLIKRCAQVTFAV